MSDRLPMLPDERPIGVWRQPKIGAGKPPWYRFNPSVPLSYLPLAVGIAAFAGLVIAFYATRRPVVLAVNGEVTTIRTHARSVRGVLSAGRVMLSNGDTVTPGLEARVGKGALVRVEAAREVRVLVDGTTYLVMTRTSEPESILAEAGITLDAADALVVERVNRPTPREVAEHPALAEQESLPVQLRVVRAVDVSVLDGERTVALKTAAPTVGEALLSMGVPLYEGDMVDPPPGTPLSPGMKITLQRALPVTILAGREMFETRTQATTVGAMLDAMGMGLTGGDYAIPAAASPILPGMEVRVVRVGEETLVEEEVILFDTTWQPVPDLELDETVVLREGQPGVLKREVRARFENGVEVSRVLRGEWVAQEPVDEVRGYGAQIVIRTLETEIGPVDYWRHIRMLATSYTAATSGKEPGAPGYGITGTGLAMRHGMVAIDPQVVNFFTQMYVPDYGLGLAADAGGAIKGLRIDLGYDEDNLEYWYAWVDVYLLTPVPDPDEIIWVLPSQ